MDGEKHMFHYQYHHSDYEYYCGCIIVSDKMCFALQHVITRSERDRGHMKIIHWNIGTKENSIKNNMLLALHNKGTIIIQ